jgi:hypothetical protein
MSNQLYAAIQEWRTGVQRSVEFSTNAYLDVYNGHVNTFNHIRLNREESFHTMMTDIYRHLKTSSLALLSRLDYRLPFFSILLM